MYEILEFCAQHLNAETLLEEEMGLSKSVNLAKLEAIDRLLWGKDAKKTPVRANPEGSFTSLGVDRGLKWPECNAACLSQASMCI